MIRPSIFEDVSDLVAGFTTRAFIEVGEEQPESRLRLAEVVGFGAVASAGQVHGSNVAVVCGAGHVSACDGLVTDRPGLLLTVVSADCAIVLLSDPESAILGACHAGWRGTLGGIVPNTVCAMEGLGASPRQIRAYISPCISTEAFEVGEEVAGHFSASVVVRNAQWQKPHVDLKAELSQQLVSSGLAEEHIEVDPACTASDAKRFYSYRAEGGTRGRMIGFIGRRTSDARRNATPIL